MKKNLLYGIIGGAAVGAAASYLMGTKDRKNLVSGLRNLGETVTGTVGGLLGGENAQGGSSSSTPTASGSSATGRSQGAKSGSKSSSSASRRG